MNADVKRRWLEALRSGDYPQATGYLRDRTGYCCLGVLCDLRDPQRWKAAPEGHSHDFAYGSELTWSSLPRDVQEWADLPNTNPRVTVDGWEWTLADLNDNGSTFARIADAIEAQL